MNKMLIAVSLLAVTLVGCDNQKVVVQISGEGSIYRVTDQTSNEGFSTANTKVEVVRSFNNMEQASTWLSKPSEKLFQPLRPYFENEFKVRPQDQICFEVNHIKISDVK